MPIDLDRRSYLGLGRARFTTAGSEPRRAFRRLGTVRPELRELLKQTPEGRSGVASYHRLLFLGYTCSLIAALVAGAAAASGMLIDLLSAMDPRRMSGFLLELLQVLKLMPAGLMALAAVPVFVLAFLVDYQAYRSILETVDSASIPAPEEP